MAGLGFEALRRTAGQAHVFGAAHSSFIQSCVVQGRPKAAATGRIVDNDVLDPYGVEGAGGADADVFLIYSDNPIADGRRDEINSLGGCGPVLGPRNLIETMATRPAIKNQTKSPTRPSPK